MAPRAGAKRDVQWLDGFRGLASFSVVCTHVTRAFDDRLFFAADDLGVKPRVLQYPFIRLIFQGNIGVAIFALLTGYVCALKPLRLARQGKQDAALSAIAKGAFRRIPRLVLPATIALVAAWTMAQLGGFTAATRSDSEWLRIATGVPGPSFSGELYRLWMNFMWTWEGERTEYDDHQWTLLPLLKGSLTAFLLVAALVYARFRVRVAIYLGYYAYWWCNDQPDVETFGQMVTWGVLLCDLSQDSSLQKTISRHSRLFVALSAFLVITGLYLASFPKYWMSASLLPWSNSMLSIGLQIFPHDVDYARRFCALGVQLTALGLQLCPQFQSFLANDVFLALGKHSFAVYLIHGTLLRSVLVWALYGVTGQPWEPRKGENGEELPPEWLQRRYHGLGFLVIVGMWLSVVYYCAWIWTVYVDGWCARVTARLEERCFEKPKQAEQSMSQV